MQGTRTLVLPIPGQENTTVSHVTVVLTSHARLGESGRATGFHFDELAAPYWALVDAGHDVTLASVAGGAAVHDPSSLAADPDERPAAVARFLADPDAMAKLSATLPIEAAMQARPDAVFLPGGHGTMFDFARSEPLAKLVGRTFDAGGIVAAVCHGPAGLIGAVRADGRPVVEGLRVNGFTDAEEEAVNLTDVVPFALETRLRELGAVFESGPNFTSYAVRDGQLVTGQNPQSAEAVARLLVAALGERSTAASTTPAPDAARSADTVDAAAPELA